MKRNYFFNKAETSVRRRQYYEDKFHQNQTYDSSNPYVKKEEYNFNDTGSTYYTNKQRSFSNIAQNSSNRSSSNKSGRAYNTLHSNQENTIYFPHTQSHRKVQQQPARRGGSLNPQKQYQSNGEYLQFYVNEIQENPYGQRYGGQDGIPAESYSTPQKTKEPVYYYYPDSQQKSISPPKHSQYEKAYQERFSEERGQGVNSAYRETNENEQYLEPAQEVPTLEEESNELMEQSGINEAYFSINDSNIHYSDQEPQQHQYSPNHPNNSNISKLGNARRRAISHDRNFSDNQYNYYSQNNSTLNNSSWIFYANKLKQSSPTNAEQAIFAETAQSKFGQNEEYQTTGNEESQMNQKQFNHNHHRKYYHTMNRKHEKMLQDVRVQGTRFYEPRPDNKLSKTMFDPQNKLQMKYINQLSLPKYISDVNDKNEFKYRKCGCGATEHQESPRNFYKREGKCTNSFYQNSTINFINY